MKTLHTLFLSAGVVLCGTLLAQTTTEPKKEKKEIVIEQTEGAKKEKMVIEIDGNTVTINGKPAEDYKGKQRIVIDDDIIINGNSVIVPGQRGPAEITRNATTRPLLGVTTEKTETGVKINSVTKESGAEKAGLKEGDIITAIGGQPVKTPEELTEAIRKHKPGDEIDVEYLRAGKKQKVKAKLGKTTDSYTIVADEFVFNYDGPRSFTIPPMPPMPRMDNEGFRNLMIYGNDRPRYGMSIQDDEDGRGVKVTGVEEESNAAKAGLKENDIITEIEGKKITNVDEVKEALAEKKEAPTVAMHVLRDGKSQTITVRVPRKLKSASL